MKVAELEPKVLWENFTALNEVPRPSKKEERVRQFMISFAKRLGLNYREDEIGNIVIEKPATKGKEHLQTVILQSHLDMVHQKNNDTVFDFDKDPIQSYIDGDWVKAKGTTLGADNGIGVAAAMAVLVSNDIEHGPIEAFFTIDEEAGMTGAGNLKAGFLKGDILFNMDSEDEGELTIGCAGGIDTNVVFRYQTEQLSGDFVGYKLTLKGLFGGHSGVDIHLQRGNANKLLNRLLTAVSKKFGVRIQEFTGGNLRNAIPREAFANIAVPGNKQSKFEAFVAEFETHAKKEFLKTDPNLTVKLELASSSKQVISLSDEKRILNAIHACPNGVHRFSNYIDDLVETSNNLAFVQAKDGLMEVKCLSRSAVDFSKDDIAQTICSVFENIGASVEHSGGYPGWEPNINSPMLEIAKVKHKDVFGYEPKIMIIHAGLECGIIGQTHPHLDMISFGPTIRFPHSPDEKVEIATVSRFWDYLKLLLISVPEKA